jgi:hypothetical protein
LSGHGELLEIVWSLELLEIVWSWRVTGSCLVIGSYWKLSGDWELLKVFWS